MQACRGRRNISVQQCARMLGLGARSLGGNGGAGHHGTSGRDAGSATVMADVTVGVSWAAMPSHPSSDCLS